LISAAVTFFVSAKLHNVVRMKQLSKFNSILIKMSAMKVHTIKDGERQGQCLIIFCGPGGRFNFLVLLNRHE